MYDTVTTESVSNSMCYHKALQLLLKKSMRATVYIFCNAATITCQNVSVFQILLLKAKN